MHTTSGTAGQEIHHQEGWGCPSCKRWDVRYATHLTIKGETAHFGTCKGCHKRLAVLWCSGEGSFTHVGVGHFLGNLRFAISRGRDIDEDGYPKTWHYVLQKLRVLLPQWALSEEDQAQLTCELAQMWAQEVQS